jgi:hypothetical protein
VPDIASVLSERYLRLRIAFAMAAAVAMFAGAGTLAWANATRSEQPPRPAALATAPVEPVISAFVPRTEVKVKPLPIPTPVFATYRSLAVHLPVKPKQVTIIAFHQAGSSRVTLHMASTAKVVKTVQLGVKPAPEKEEPGESDEIAEAEAEPAPATFAGSVIRLWRSTRQGDPDTAADCGSKPGTQVYAPVTGTVAAVHIYPLYGKYPDYEIHIVPAGWDHVDCVVLHTTGPMVHAGEEVVGGVTPISHVRNLSLWFASQLDDYTHDGGNHVHIQLDQLPSSGTIKLMGGGEEVDVPR